MDKQTKRLRLPEHFSLRAAICIGLALLLIVASLAGHRAAMTTTAAAESAMDAMKRQCISFNKLTAADRTKSLFRLSDIVRELSDHLALEPELVNDGYLEKYVDGLRLSGIAVLDGSLTLEASGYTRQFRGSTWASSLDGSRFADILVHPAKVYLERVLTDGEYYDVCAVARQDTSGIIVGFYRQPSGLITDTEKDLESMLTGLQLERGGHYAIAENGEVRVTSDKPLVGAAVADSTVLQALSQLPKDGRLHLFRADGSRFWGYRSGCEGYSLYIYYPVSGMISACLLSAAVFAALYSVLLLLFITSRSRALREKQEQLRKSNRELEQTVEVLKALETIYFTLFYVDLDTDHYESIYIAPWLEERIPQEGSYTELKQIFLDTVVLPAYSAEIDRRMSVGFIRESLSQAHLTDARKSFYTDYQALRGTEIKWRRVTTTAVDYRDDGKPRHVLTLLQDVDEEKAKEADYQARIMKEAEEARIAANAKSEFLRRISHDIRTPINGVQGYIDLAARHPDDPQLQQHCRENATIALRALLDLVNSILNMSKLESDEVVLEEKPFDLTQLLDNANTVLQPQAAVKNVGYEVLRRGGVAIPHLIGSPLHLTQIIMNMTGNAVKYSRPGGCVRVNTELVSRTEDEATYEFICEDNGIGMSDDFQTHMYEPFAQETVSARSTYEGAGLGLSIMKKLVDAMHGTVTCESRKGVGTTFRVRLTFRIDKAYSSPDAETAQTVPGAAPSEKHVLLVEDNKLNMEIAEILLTEGGASVTGAWNGQEAVERFAASPIGFYDIIFMDIMMPEMDGMEAAAAIRALHRPDAADVPILAMSANSFPDDVQRALDAGMNGHIAKPIDAAVLYDALEKYTR